MPNRLTGAERSEVRMRRHQQPEDMGLPSIPPDVAARLGDGYSVSTADKEAADAALKAFYDAAAAQRKASVVCAGGRFEKDDEKP
jgi:hypothetical protein